MAGEVFNLAILLTAKDAASGTLDRFAANSHRATENIKKDLASLDKTTKAQIDAITKNIGKKTAEVGKLGNQFNKIDTLNAKGLASAEKRSTSILTNLQNEAKGLDVLSQKLRADGKEDAAKAAEKLSRSLKDEVKQMESVGSKLKQIQKLRAEGTDEAKAKAAALAAEIKTEVRSLDQLKSKWEEVKELQSDTLDTKFKSDGFRQQISQIEDLENHYEKLRENLNRDLAIGGIGAGGLSLMYKGIKVAADFQSSMTDLRATFSKLNEGGSSVDINQLAGDMIKAEAIAVRLGNQLPGTTEDFVQMLSVLKQNGLDTETIFNGAADAVANLAVANNDVPKEIAKDFAQFGQLFNLKPEEYVKAADTFSRLFTSSGIGSSELIEALKYFQGRSGSALGIKGIEDAEKVTRLMGLLKKQGLEGSLGGSALNNLFSGYLSARNKKDDPVERLKKLEGIDLKLFDDKGNFAGIDNLFKQLEPLQKLTEEKRIGYLKEIFGEEGMSAATAILKTGAEGWKQYNATQNQTIALQQKNAEKAKDFNNQLESLLGTAKNLAVTTFQPILPEVTNGVTSLNNIVSSMQEIAKENPNLAKTLLTIAGYGSTAMIVYSAFKTLTTGVRMFRIASAFSRGDGLATYLSSTASAANVASTSMATATTKATGLRGAINNLRGSQTVKIGVQIGAILGIEYLIGIIHSEIQKAIDAGDARKNSSKSAQQNFQAFQQTEQNGTQFAKSDFENQANTTWFSVMKSGLGDTLPSQFGKKSLGMQLSTAATQTFLYPLTKFSGATNPFIGKFGYEHNAKSYGQGFKQTAPELADSRIMAAFLRQLETRIPDQKEREKVKEGLQSAFPESFSIAMKEIAGLSFAPLTESVNNLSTQMNAQALSYETQNQTLTTFSQNLSNLQQPFEQTQTNVANLGSTAQNVPPTLNRISSSANSASSALDSMSTKLSNWQPPVPQLQTYQIGVPNGTSISPSVVPAHAVGGIVERDGVAMLHAGNVITPAKTTKGLRGFNSLMSLAEDNQSRSPRIADVQNFGRGETQITVSAPMTVTIHGGGSGDQAVQKLEKKLDEFQKNLGRNIGRMMESGRLRG